ncbi:hypothetical protein [Pseudomonas sp. AP-1]|uniref:hypothetical protein n=1 Tax=unclassified Pseudomonas TaxID=196821 RepID=UPI0035B18718
MKQLKSDVKPGSIFYIPALNRDKQSGFVLARFIEHVESNAGFLIEVFSKFYSLPPKSLSEVEMSERLFRPILCSLRFSEIPRWKVLFEDLQYEPSSSGYADIVLEYHSDLWIGGNMIKKKLTDQGFSQGANALEWATCWRMHHIVFRVNACLAGYFEPEEAYDDAKLPESMQIGNKEAGDVVVLLARKIDDFFKVL